MSSVILAGEYVTDTVALVLWLEKRRMGAQAQSIFKAAEAGQTIVHVPAMTLAEILYLSEKQRIQVTLSDVASQMQSFPNFREYPMNRFVIDEASIIMDIPELHDRLIAATARSLNAPLGTCKK